MLKVMKKFLEDDQTQIDSDFIETQTIAAKPVAEVIPFSQSDMEPRPFGLCKGQFFVPDNFDAPLSNEISASFGGAISTHPTATTS